MPTVVLQTRVDADTKKKAEELFDSPGLDTTTAIRLFLKQAINQQRIPFEIIPPQTIFPEKTLAAIEEAKKISRDPTVKSYSGTKDLLADCD